MILCFGEIMLRLATPGALRFRQALPGALEATFGGGEANVAVSLALLGLPSRYLTALPRHAISDSLVATLRGLGVDASAILFTRQGRLGVYFFETGANQRGSVVIYDRGQSSVALTGPEDYDFEAALEGVDGVHLTGITPALSEPAFNATLELARRAKERGASVSCDLNFRKKLWNWKPGVGSSDLAQQCMRQILPHVDLVIGNEEDAENVLSIAADDTSAEEGRINAAAYAGVARRIAEQFPNVRQVAITLRQSVSADHNNWGGMLFDVATDRAFFAPLDPDGRYRPYEIRDIVDRVGAGDAFSAGLLFALRSDKYGAPEAALRFAVAAGCLKHSVRGDLNYASEEEIATLMTGAGTGRVKR